MFFNSFIPVFVAVDAFGVLPMFISLTEGMKKICLFLLGFSNENSGNCGFQRYLQGIYSSSRCHRGDDGEKGNNADTKRYLIYKLKGGQEDEI